MSEPEPPQDVRLVVGGREYPCDVLRDPELDEDGFAAWVVVPRHPVPPGLRGESMAVRAAVLPARTLLSIRLEVGRE